MPEPRDLPARSENAVTVRGVLERVSLVVAPPTLVIALAFWFGWTLTNARSAYFGIDTSELGFSTVDHLLRSADATFVPVAVILLVVLAAIMLHGFIQHSLGARRRVNAVLRGATCAAALGAVTTCFAIWTMFEPLPVRIYYLVPPVSLGLGPALIAYPVWIFRHAVPPGKKNIHHVTPGWERSFYAIAGMLALLGVFWATSGYAAALGRGRAQILAENLTGQPAVAVFSTKDLDIDAPGVTATEIAGPDSEFRFKYAGLRLLIRSNNKYFLVNDNWSNENGVTIVLQDTPAIRLEFTPGR